MASRIDISGIFRKLGPSISPLQEVANRGPCLRRGTSFGINFEGLVLVSLGRAPSRQGVRLYEKNAYSSLERSKNHPCHQNLVTMNGYQWSKHAVLAALILTSICCAVLTLQVLGKESNKKELNYGTHSPHSGVHYLRR
jgi:hypothetical protein